MEAVGPPLIWEPRLVGPACRGLLLLITQTTRGSSWRPDACWAFGRSRGLCLANQSHSGVALPFEGRMLAIDAAPQPASPLLPVARAVAAGGGRACAYPAGRGGEPGGAEEAPALMLPFVRRLVSCLVWLVTFAGSRGVAAARRRTASLFQLARLRPLAIQAGTKCIRMLAPVGLAPSRMAAPLSVLCAFLGRFKGHCFLARLRQRRLPRRRPGYCPRRFKDSL